jgi:hypothetical protein
MTLRKMNQRDKAVQSTVWDSPYLDTDKEDDGVKRPEYDPDASRCEPPHPRVTLSHPHPTTLFPSPLIHTNLPLACSHSERTPPGLLSTSLARVHFARSHPDAATLHHCTPPVSPSGGPNTNHPPFKFYIAQIRQCLLTDTLGQLSASASMCGSAVNSDR